MNLKFSEFYKNVITLVGGSTIATAIPVIITPILSRLFTPDEFGALAVFISLTLILSSFSTGRFELAILLPKNESRANYLVLLSIITSFLLCVIFLIIIIIFDDWIALTLNFEGQLPRVFIYLVPFTVFMLSLTQVFNYQLIRKKRFKAISGSNVVKTASVPGVQLSLYNYSSSGLASGFIFGSTFGTLVFGYFALKKTTLFSQRYKKSLFKKLALLYSDFPKYSAPHSFTNTTSSNLPQLLLSSFFTPAVTGAYAFSTRICFTPIRLLSASVHQVFSQSISEQYNQGKNIYPTTLKAIKQIALVGIIPFLILLAFSPQIFGFVFGEEWIEAGVYSQILAPYLYLVFVLTPITFIPMLLNRQRKAFVIDICYLLLRAIALLIGSMFFDAIIAISLFSLVGFFVQLYVLFWILQISKNSDK